MANILDNKLREDLEMLTLLVTEEIPLRAVFLMLAVVWQVDDSFIVSAICPKPPGLL